MLNVGDALVSSPVYGGGGAATRSVDVTEGASTVPGPLPGLRPDLPRKRGRKGKNAER
jgi:hypothetical protein